VLSTETLESIFWGWLLIAEFQITIATIPADKPAFTIATIA